MMRVSDTFVGKLTRATRPSYSFAVEVGLSPYRLSRLIRGHVDIEPADHKALIAIGKALGLKVAEVFDQ